MSGFLNLVDETSVDVVVATIVHLDQ